MSLDELGRDFRHALRSLHKAPGFTIISVLTIAIGIGVNTALFSLVNSLLLRPLPVEHPSQIVVVASRGRNWSEPHDVSYLDFLDFRNQASDIADLFAYQIDTAGFAVNQQPNRVTVSYVDGRYFSTLGIRPLLGRLIQPGEGQTPGSSPIIVLGDSFFLRRFSGSEAILGKGALINGRPDTIVGVTPKGFRGTFSLAETDLYLPLSQRAPEDPEFWTARDHRGEGNFTVMARLKPNVSLQQARSLLNVIAERLARQYPKTNKDIGVDIFPERLARPQASAANNWPTVLSLFFALALIVFSVASVNLLNLLHVRASSRFDEIALRYALGARPLGLLQQALIENLPLALLGGGLGVFIGWWGSLYLRSAIIPADMPLLNLTIATDWRVFLYGFVLAMVAGLLGSVAAVWSTAGIAPGTLLHGIGRTYAGKRTRSRVRSALVISQISGSLVLLVVTGLLVQNLINAQNLNLGFDPNHILNMSMDVKEIGYDETNGKAFFAQLGEKVGSLPGVQSAAYAYSPPFCNYTHTAKVYFDNPSAPSQEAPELYYNIVDTAYLPTLRIPIIRGRGFADSDNSASPKVAIISEAMADHFWRSQDPLGRTFRISEENNPRVHIVGIARNAHFVTPTLEPEQYIYLPLSQNYSSRLTLQIRTSNFQIVAPEVIQQIHALAPNLPVFNVASMKNALDGASGLFLFRLGVKLAASLAIIGTLLAIIGVYGVVSNAITLRRREFGIRMALGAGPGGVTMLALRYSFRLLVAGIAVGFLISLMVSRVLSSALVGVSAFSFSAVMVPTILLSAVAVLASYIPSRRTGRIDPARELRCE